MDPQRWAKPDLEIKEEPVFLKTEPIEASEEKHDNDDQKWNHRQMKNHVCTGCNYSTPWKANIVRHIKVAHLKVKDVLCSLCPFASDSHRNLRCHMKAIHHKIKDNKCEEPGCTFASSQIQGLRRHKEEVHGKLKKNFCDQCSFRSYQKRSLETHVNNVHMGIRTFQCQHCDKKPFKLKGTLVAHIRKCHKDNPEAMDSIHIIQPHMKRENEFDGGLEDTTEEAMRNSFQKMLMELDSPAPVDNQSIHDIPGTNQRPQCLSSARFHFFLSDFVIALYFHTSFASYRYQRWARGLWDFLCLIRDPNHPLFYSIFKKQISGFCLICAPFKVIFFRKIS